MRRPRVFVDLELSAERRTRLPDAVARHLVQVLRLRAGDGLALFNGDGRDYPAELLHARRGEVEVRVDAPGPPEPAQPLAIHLGIGVSKGERMDFALQKAVELGVTSLTPLFTGRSVVRLGGDRLAKRVAHWRGVLVAACEQSGRRTLPRLGRTQTLDAWLEADHPCPLLLDHRADSPLTELSPPAQAVTLLIGPEGGLAPGERARARSSGFLGVRLGPRILRTETAPLAAIAVIQALWGDLRR